MEALRLWQKIHDFARRTGNLRRELAMLNNLALVEPDLTRRRALIKLAVALDRKHWPGSNFHSCSLNCMGGIATLQKDYATAYDCLKEAHDIAVVVGSEGMLAIAEDALAEFYCERTESLDHAEQLFSEAQTMYDRLGEYPCIAHTMLTRFRIVLKRNDPETALHHVRTCLLVNRNANLVDEAQYIAQRDDLIRQLRDASYEAQATAL